VRGNRGALCGRENPRPKHKISDFNFVNPSAPQWASTTMGVFVCTMCSGAHLAMGSHIISVNEEIGFEELGVFIYTSPPFDETFYDLFSTSMFLFHFAHNISV